MPSSIRAVGMWNRGVLRAPYFYVNTGDWPTIMYNDHDRWLEKTHDCVWIERETCNLSQIRSRVASCNLSIPINHIDRTVLMHYCLPSVDGQRASFWYSFWEQVWNCHADVMLSDGILFQVQMGRFTVICSWLLLFFNFQMFAPFFYTQGWGGWDKTHKLLLLHYVQRNSDTWSRKKIDTWMWLENIRCPYLTGKKQSRHTSFASCNSLHRVVISPDNLYAPVQSK